MSLIKSFLKIVNQQITSNLMIQVEFDEDKDCFMVVILDVNEAYKSTFDPDQIHEGLLFIDLMKLVHDFIEEIRVEIGQHIISSYKG